MSHVFLLLTAYVVNAVWQVPILAAAAWCLARWMKPAGPELQHKIWVAAFLLATLVPATPAIASYCAPRALQRQASAAVPIIGAPAARHIPLRGAELIVAPAIVYLIGGFYLAALSLCALRLARLLYRTAGLVRHAEAIAAEPDYAALWHASTQKFSVPSAVLLRSRDVPGPVTAGIGRPVLLLPATFLETASRTEFLAAVAHECAHMQRADFRKNVFYEVAALFTVFHPITWFLKSQIAQTREIVCDRMAAEQLPDRRTYALSLLQLAGKMPAAPVVSPAMGMFDGGILERRILTLTTSLPPMSRMQRCVRSLGALLLLAICTGGLGSMAQTAATQKQKSPDLSCTYYGKEKRGYEGTCGYDKSDKTKYRCYLNADPAQSNTQLACEWKVRRAEAAKK